MRKIFNIDIIIRNLSISDEKSDGQESKWSITADCASEINKVQAILIQAETFAKTGKMQPASPWWTPGFFARIDGDDRAAETDALEKLPTQQECSLM